MDEVADNESSGGTGRSLYISVLVVGAAYFFSFVCYGGTDGLQTASSGYIGGVNLPRAFVAAVLCAASVVSSLLLAPAFVTRLSLSTALCVAWGSHALYAIASLYPTAATLIPAAIVVGATMPVVAVAQGGHVVELVDRWCSQQAGDEEDDLRLSRGLRRPSLRCCTEGGCRRGRIDVNLRRQNIFIMFNSILMACMAAGSLCGSVVGSLLVGSAAESQQLHVTSTAIASAVNCSLDSYHVDCITRTVPHSVVIFTSQDGVDSSPCGINRCPYMDSPVVEQIQSSPSTWHALIFVLLCNVVGVVLTAFLPTFLRPGDVRRSTQSSTQLPFFGWRQQQQSPLDDTQTAGGGGGYSFVGGIARRAGVESMRHKTLTTLRLFTNRRVLLLAPTSLAAGITGSLTVAAFHQSFMGCAHGTKMVGHGTAYQRAGFIVASFLSGQLTIHWLQRRTVVLGFLLTAIFTVASIFTWQTSLSHLALVVVWCALNGAIAGVLRPATFSIYAEWFGRDSFDSALLHANLWDSVGAALAAIIADKLCLVIRAWVVIFVAGAVAVTYAGLECLCQSECNRGGDGDLDSDVSNRSVAAAGGVIVNGADRESLASVCLSPSPTDDNGSVSTISNNQYQMNLRLQSFDNRAL